MLEFAYSESLFMTCEVIDDITKTHTTFCLFKNMPVGLVLAHIKDALEVLQNIDRSQKLPRVNLTNWDAPEILAYYETIYDPK
jgi:hypothetical protein